MVTTIFNHSHTRHKEAREIRGRSAAALPALPEEIRFNAGREPAGTQLIPVATIPDIVMARQRGRELADQYGHPGTQATLIATVISELSRNMVLYAKGGTISLSTTAGNQGIGIVISAEDKGPGIPQVERALMGGYSTSGGLGLGLCGVRRIADEFQIATQDGKGTKVTVTKWLV